MANIIKQYRNSIAFHKVENSKQLLINELIKAFINEAELYAKSNSDYGLWNEYAERPMVSFMIQGLLRGSKTITALQEFGVYSNKKFIGRADAFIHIKDKAILIESKFITDSAKRNHWNKEGFEKYIKEVEDQGKKYSNALEEKKYYRELFHKKTYLLSLVFHRIIRKDINEFIEEISPNLQSSMIEKSFYTFLYLDIDVIQRDKIGLEERQKYGIEIYGKIEDIF